MAKIALIIILVLLAPAASFAQGILESVLGPGGLGVWNGGASNQFNYQQFQGQEQPNQQAPNQYAQPNQAYGPPQGYSPPPAYPNYSQQGVYSDWQNYQQPANTPQGPPPVSYVPPPTQQAAPPMQAQPGQTGPAPYSAAGQPPQFGDDLPAGAVRITTQTPEGTSVQYYPPQGEDEGIQAPPGRQTRQRRAAPKQARTKKQSQAQRVTGAPTESPGTSIAMPHPVEIPQGQDPRTGWNSFNKAVPVAPQGQ
ncbi:MAG: hypothetical protein M1511_15240 [Deltaproteobacteria bacterium]|nr:hypothetical protein [Deltaproteobacteria bacterium]